MAMPSVEFSVVTPRLLRERGSNVFVQKTLQGEGFSQSALWVEASLTPHPALRATFSLKGRREERDYNYGAA